MSKHRGRLRLEDDDQNDRKRPDRKEKHRRRPKGPVSRMKSAPFADDELESFLLDNDLDDDFGFDSDDGDFFDSDSDSDSDLDDTEH